MKLPSLGRVAKPDPDAHYKTCAGFVVDAPNRPNWAPTIGTTLRGTDPELVYLWSIGASRFFVSADSDDTELPAAYSRETFGPAAAKAPPPAPSIQTPGRPMVSVKPIQVGHALIPVGSLADASAAMVRRFPGSWKSAEPDGYSA